MAIRFFWSRRNGNKRTDPVRIAASRRPDAPVKVLRAGVEPKPGLTVVEPDAGADPYNSTGRFLADRVRFEQH